VVAFFDGGDAEPTLGATPDFAPTTAGDGAPTFCLGRAGPTRLPPGCGLSGVPGQRAWRTVGEGLDPKVAS
jgi:hypothetical protein